MTHISLEEKATTVVEAALALFLHTWCDTYEQKVRRLLRATEVESLHQAFIILGSKGSDTLLKVADELGFTGFPGSGIVGQQTVNSMLTGLQEEEIPE